MNDENIHARARRLILDRTIDGLSAADVAWLEDHLGQCGDCAAYAGSTGSVVVALRSQSVTADVALVEATRRSVRLHARYLQESENRQRMLALSCVLAAIWGALTQPLLWRGFRWLGETLDVSAPVWQAVFLMLWLLPAVVLALVFLHHPRIAQLARQLDR